jgi:hypothetical protein
MPGSVISCALLALLMSTGLGRGAALLPRGCRRGRRRGLGGGTGRSNQQQCRAGAQGRHPRWKSHVSALSEKTKPGGIVPPGSGLRTGERDLVSFTLHFDLLVDLDRVELRTGAVADGAGLVGRIGHAARHFQLAAVEPDVGLDRVLSWQLTQAPAYGVVTMSVALAVVREALAIAGVAVPLRWPRRSPHSPIRTSTSGCWPG